MLRRATLLIVDDMPANIAAVAGVLNPLYRTRIANNGQRALQIAQGEDRPDLILLDVNMPGLDGYEVCRRLKTDPATADTPVIFLTAQDTPEDEQRGFDAGAVDFITKPISPPTVLARVKTHLQLKESGDFLRDHNQFLENEVRRRMHEVEELHSAIIMSMASLAETRDNETGNHILRTQQYVLRLCRGLAGRPGFSRVLTEPMIDCISRAAPLHDIGKVGIPDHILLKPGRLDVEEFEIMKTHTTLGGETIKGAMRHMNKPSRLLCVAYEIATHHHERWDGGGYPSGLRGEEIPLAARIMAVADVYDALISKRVYKGPISHAEAVDLLLEGRGAHFDPCVVDCFAELGHEFRRIAELFGDESEKPPLSLDVCLVPQDG